MLVRAQRLKSADDVVGSPETIHFTQPSLILHLITIVLFSY